MQALKSTLCSIKYFIDALFDSIQRAIGGLNIRLQGVALGYAVEAANPFVISCRKCLQIGLDGFRVCRCIYTFKRLAGRLYCSDAIFDSGHFRVFGELSPVRGEPVLQV